MLLFLLLFSPPPCADDVRLIFFIPLEYTEDASLTRPVRSIRYLHIVISGQSLSSSYSGKKKLEEEIIVANGIAVQQSGLLDRYLRAYYYCGLYE